MRRSVLVYGIVLIVIGLVGYAAGGLQHWTALIPTVLGALAAAAAWLVRTSTVILAAAALTIAAIALAGTAGALILLPHALGGDPEFNSLAVYARAATAIASLALVIALVIGMVRRRAQA